MLELLAPAGNFQKLKTAFHFGADAVYLGGKAFSLRAQADNFELDEIEQAVDYAHNLNKKVYVTANIFAKNSDFALAEKYFRFLEKIKADAVLITDPGFIALCREVAPTLPIHLSTQANTLNKYAVKFWAGLGISRIVLARELSLKDVREIHEYNKDTELEAFVHGAMCISYSGRCLLSNYLSSRDSNRGECVQACRWNYEIREPKCHESSGLTVEEDGRCTYFLNSKDLNLLENIPELSDAGIVSLKIEGRMKSEYYVALVVSAYRRAIDEFLKTGKIESADILNAEMEKTSHRKYTKAFFLEERQDTVNYDEERDQGEGIFTAYVLSYRDGVCEVEMRNRFKVGEELEIISPAASHNKRFIIEKMWDENGGELLDAKLVQEKVKIKIPYSVEEGDILSKYKK